MSLGFDVASAEEGSALVIDVSGRVDGTNASAFDTSLQELIGESSQAIVLDLDGLTYMSSAGLRTILMTAKRLQARKAELALCSLRSTINEIFQIAGFDRILAVCDTRSEAVAKVTSA
ncbi:MAG: STAS domain-containing protein [Gammaproteobacteria bacterium]|nr:STAS domain-containing protein [Gammaproteobacteria bacterium]